MTQRSTKCHRAGSLMATKRIGVGGSTLNTFKVAIMPGAGNVNGSYVAIEWPNENALTEYHGPINSPHLLRIAAVCLEMLEDPSLDDTTRLEYADLLRWVVEQAASKEGQHDR
jgi:hypothetical protein